MEFVLILLYLVLVLVLVPDGDKTVEVPHAMTAAEFNGEEACRKAGEAFKTAAEAFRLTHTALFVCVPKGPEP